MLQAEGSAWVFLYGGENSVMSGQEGPCLRGSGADVRVDAKPHSG